MRTLDGGGLSQVPLRRGWEGPTEQMWRADDPHGQGSKSALGSLARV